MHPGVIAVMAASALCLSPGRASATTSTTALKPTDALVSVSDISAGTSRAVKASAWRTALHAAHAAAAAGVLTVADTTPLTAISRAVVAPSLTLARRYQRVAAALAPRVLDGLDTAALAAPAASLAGATRATWRDGVVVGQITLLDPGARMGPGGATSLAATVQARVHGLATMPAWDALVASAVARAKPPDVHTALQAFALAFGPVPRVRTPPGPPGDVSQTLALDWVAQNASHLTKAQRAAVRRALPQASHTARAAAAGPSAKQRAEDQRTADDALAFLSARLRLPGRTPRDIVRYADSPKEGAEAITLAPREDMPAPVAALIGGEATPRDCSLFLYGPLGKFPGGQGLTGEDRRYVIAHEVFHCLMEHGLGWVTNNRALPWVGEGGATFAGCEFAPGATYADGPHGWYGKWIDFHNWPITTQSYSGIGLLTLMQSQGVNVLGRLALALSAGWNDPSATFDAAAGGSRQDVLDNWASTFLTNDATRTEPGWGPGTQGCLHAQSADRGKPAQKKIDVDQTVSVAQEPWTTGIYGLTGDASVIHVQTTRGDVRINGGAKTDDKNVTDAYYCLREGGCPCGPSAAKDLSPKTRAPLAAVTGGDRGAYVTFTGVREVCPIITQARFAAPSATFTASEQSLSWVANVFWDVSWDATSNPSSLPLRVGTYQYATRGTMAGGGSYTRTSPSQPTCTGDLTIVGPDSPIDALIKVTGDTGPGPGRAWTIELWATSYDIFSTSSSCSPPPPFGVYDDSFNSHLWMTTITLPATGSTTPHTVTLSVAADPSHAAHESWTGTVTLTGIF